MRVGQSTPHVLRTRRRSPPLYLPLLLLLFAGSGCSALIYEIVWYQLLQLVIGSSAVSLGVLLATFMGGLCLGSLLLPRLPFCARQHPLRVYGKIELGIGRLRHARALRDAAGGLGLHRRRRPRAARHPAARAGVRALPVAAHLSDGRVAARPRRAG